MATRVLVGDCRSRLAELPEQSVHCCVTSPPYWGLRDYGTEPQVWGGGWRGELGQEPTPEAYVANLVAVFRAVWRVLRDDGTLWLNLGDSYAGGGGFSPGSPSNSAEGRAERGARDSVSGKKSGGVRPQGVFKAKDLVGIPWMVAFALRADGWYLRSDIIWHKPNPMPESVTDRPTRSHEYVFLLTKKPRYYFDAEAIREPHATAGDSRNRPDYEPKRERNRGGRTDGYTAATGAFSWPASGRNRRTVWTIPTHPLKDAHFATFPPALVEPCIKAGTSEKGCCGACGAGWRRVVERVTTFGSGSGRAGNVPIGKYAGAAQAVSGEYDIRMGPQVQTTTTGWAPGCTCDSGDPIPATVLDPFSGAGTTALVAERLGRDAVIVELSEPYSRLAEQRLRADAPMFANVTVERVGEEQP